jgi:hypothetical protein
MLYSIGKNSAVMLPAIAFYPARPPFPLLRRVRGGNCAMIEFVRMVKDLGQLLVRTNHPTCAGISVHTAPRSTRTS